VSGQEGQRVRRAEQGTNKGNQKPTKLFVRQHWPQTEIFHTKEALHRTATFIKEGNFTPAFRFLPMKRAPHEDTGTSNRGLTVPLALEVLNDEHCTFPAVYVLSSRPVTSVM